MRFNRFFQCIDLIAVTKDRAGIYCDSDTQLFGFVKQLHDIRTVKTHLRISTGMTEALNRTHLEFEDRQPALMPEAHLSNRILIARINDHGSFQLVRVLRNSLSHFLIDSECERLKDNCLLNAKLPDRCQ